jgi:uroporphyrinogen-III synthase
MKVLVTKKLSHTNLEILQSKGWDVDQIDVLKITPLEIKEPKEADGWIISSRNSWPAVKKFVSLAPISIFCVGSWIESELKKNGVQSEIKSYNSMKLLADELPSKSLTRLLYFCGDHHRHELISGFPKNSMLTKVITHESRLTYPILKNKYDAIFVFSPRSVESLLKNNTFASHTTFACIGPTTAAYLQQQGLYNTYCSSIPDSEVLVKEFCDKLLSGF